MAEALNGAFKDELIKLHGPRRTRRQLEIAIIEWVAWHNHHRLQSEIGDIPPAENEQHWYRQQFLALTAGKSWHSTHPHNAPPRPPQLHNPQNPIPRQNPKSS